MADVVLSKAFRKLGSATLVAVAAGGAVFAIPAQAQNNPFIPSRGADKAYVDRQLDERFKDLEAKLRSSGAGAATAVPGSVAGGPVVPGQPVATPPGLPGIAPFTGQPAAPYVRPLLTLEDKLRARTTDVRFIGCINGEPKFVRAVSGNLAAAGAAGAATPAAPALDPSLGTPIQANGAGAGAAASPAAQAAPSMATGERVVFSPSDLRKAVAAGILPRCR